ncbi:MAG: peptide chain release factor-like protein [Planctomycetota bacterium]|nr:peptide chain release factor-like protein [Planctomycetota bacterium]
MAAPHPASLDEDVLLAQCVAEKGRSSGPGGQHRNKVETKVTLTHGVSGVSAHASERRSAEQNRRVALFRLRLALAVRVRCPPVVRDAWGDTRSELWRKRVSREGRIACNPEHGDYPAMLAEAIDVLAASGWDAKDAALRLACSASQLVKLVHNHPAAMDAWNRQRIAHGMRPLK